MKTKTTYRRSLGKVACLCIIICALSGGLLRITVLNVHASSPTGPATFEPETTGKVKDSFITRLTFPGLLYSEVHQGNEHEKIDEHFATVQLTKVYPQSPPNYAAEPKKRNRGFSLFESIERVQLVLLGGVLLIIGGVFISSLLPQMTGARVPIKLSQSKKVRSRSNSGVKPKTYETPLGNLTDLTSSRSAASRLLADKQLGKNPPVTQNILQDIPEEILLVDDAQETAESSLSSLPNPSPSLMKLTHTFFQQGQFEFVEQSGTLGRIRSCEPQYQQYGDIPIFIVSKTPLKEALVREIYNTIRMPGRPSQPSIAVMVVDEQPYPCAYQQIYRYRTERQFTFIPISSQLITKAIRNSTCQQTTEKIFSSGLLQRDVYEHNNPAEHSLEFFGRTKLLENLLESIGHLQHIGLFGLRSIGKTSLIWQLREQLAHHIVAYVDLQHVPRNCEYLYRMILEECLREASYKYPEIKLPDVNVSEREMSENQGVTFLQDLVKLWESLKKGCHDIKVILFLDEAEQFVPNFEGNDDGFAGFHEFIGILRGISQQYGFLVSIVASSRPEISRLDRCQGQSNPGFQFYKEVFLSSLTEDGCNQMITSLGAQMGLTYSEESLSRIYYETGGHPHITRQLCSLIAENSKVFEEVNGEAAVIQVQDVENAISEYIEYKSDYLDSVWQRLSSVEQDILLAIFTNDSCALKELIAHTHDYDVKRQRRKAISTLIENEIIEKCENKYSIKMGLFERFLLSSN